jgi:hypothetical protein
MTDPVQRLAAAEIEASAARERLSSTLALLQARLNPKRLARQAIRDVADKGSAVAVAGVEGAKRNPGALAGVTALAGLFLARHQIADLVRDARGTIKKTRAEHAPPSKRTRP